MTKLDGEIDHIVLLLPYDQLLNPPAWITDNFTLSPGGRHGDNKTENRLVLFRDGSYVELISFINDDPEKRRGHWWDKPFGVVDFALTTAQPLDHSSLVQRLEKSNTGITYAEPKEGGRHTNGRDIRWRVTFPPAPERGNVPFFCEDITSRSWRVPITEENTTHPCGALGVGGIVMEVGKESLERLRRANAAVLGVEAGERYEIGVPNEVEKLKHPTLRLREAAQGSDKELALTLILQTGSQSRREPIREKIGDGLVSVDFE